MEAREVEITTVLGSFGRLPDRRWGVWAVPGLPAGTRVLVERKSGAPTYVTIGAELRRSVPGTSALYLQAGQRLAPIDLRRVVADRAIGSRFDREIRLAAWGARRSGPCPLSAPPAPAEDPAYGPSLADREDLAAQADGLREARAALLRRR